MLDTLLTKFIVISFSKTYPVFISVTLSFLHKLNFLHCVLNWSNMKSSLIIKFGSIFNLV